MGLQIPRLDSFMPDDVERFLFQVKADLLQGERAMTTAIAFTGGKINGLEPTSQAYALAVAALAIEGQNIFRSQWSDLMSIVSEIRPPSTGGRMKRVAPPEKFGDQWPHERLGHATWTAFVEAPPKGKRKNGREYEVPPGLGVSSKYEAHLFKGWQKLGALVDVAMPTATAEEKDSVKNQIVAASGPGKLAQIGGGKGVRANTFSTEQAASVVENLKTGGPAQADLEARGLDALTNPRPKGQRRAKEPLAESPKPKLPPWPVPPEAACPHCHSEGSHWVLREEPTHDGETTLRWLCSLCDRRFAPEQFQPTRSLPARDELRSLCDELTDDEVTDVLASVRAILNGRTT